MTVNHAQNKPWVGYQQSGPNTDIDGVHNAPVQSRVTRTFGDREFFVRRPLLSDFPRWSRARTEHARHLAPAFGEARRSWRQLNTGAAWVEKYMTERRLFRQGLAYPHLLFQSTPDAVSLVGEVDISRVDGLSRAGELSIWCSPDAHRSVIGWAGASVVLTMFTMNNPLRWVMAPVAVGNPRPAATLRAVGFEKSATLRRQRDYAGTPTDHELWIYENTPDNRVRLRELMELR